MRKILLTALCLMAAVSAKAQFEEGTCYVNTSLTGLNLTYSANEKWNFGVQATGGYFLADSFMGLANVQYDHKDGINDFSAGLGARYYFLQNGVYMQAGAKYEHKTSNENNVYISPEVGYCFYLSHTVSIEPAVYYDMSVNDFSDKSRVGLKVGFGFYF